MNEFSDSIGERMLNLLLKVTHFFNLKLEENFAPKR